MKNAAKTAEQYELPMVNLGDLMTLKIRAEAAVRLRIWNGLPQDFVHDSIPIGAFAAGNLSANWKRDVLNSSDSETVARVRLMAEEALAVYLAMYKFLKQSKARHLIYYAEYANELVVAAACRKLGVRVTPVIHSSLNGNDFRRLGFIDRVPQLFDGRRRRADWPHWRPLSLDARQVKLIADDIVTRLLGRSGIVYSPPLGAGGQNLFSRLNLTPGRKLLSAFTSSQDENNNVGKFRDLYGFPIAPFTRAFESQMQWLDALCRHVEDSDDLQLVIRFHPRLAKNTRSVAEADYEDQVAALERLDCRHVRVVRPEHAISSYGLAEISDVVLTAWTSVGPEAAKLGMPVIQTFQGENSFPVGSFLRSAATKEDYVTEIRRAIADRPNTDFFREAFRFAYMYFAANELDFGDIVSRFDDPTLPKYRTPAVADYVDRFTIGGESAQSVMLQEQRARQSNALRVQETEALLEAAARFIHVLAFQADTSEALRIGLGAGESSGNSVTHHDIMVSVEEDLVTVSLGDKCISKRSRMIANLAELAGSMVLERAKFPHLTGSSQ
jgi:hypothetical protein